ncbi:hypothetical protein BKP35_09600 [Anaerobacillus arseniciselenatis]|uniref:DUF2564 domain-containing protein n=1 Tax=Anaerobacillus arseniciselenatis TaxID=85682 RepID=A0A1S2LM98_9BACI|nr:DUF2564 family protein [Anaerobacillus arseniciselenatis]OIJ12817.1 hypothetical protein BKP35_09600 [Anaerobacillus arseniciselenatis]
MSEPFNDIRQVEMAIKAAQRMVGQATMSMDEDQLKAATDALNQAKKQYQDAVSHATGVDDQFFEFSSELIERIDHQLQEAKE